MDAQLFKRLVECNAEQSWELIREVVGIQLMGKSKLLFCDFSEGGGVGPPVLTPFFLYILPDPFASIIDRCTFYSTPSPLDPRIFVLLLIMRIFLRTKLLIFTLMISNVVVFFLQATKCFQYQS